MSLIRKNLKICILSIVPVQLFYGHSYADGHDSSSQNSMHNWDMDNDGALDALTDGLLMLRYTFNLRGDSLTAGAISTGSSLSSSEVEARIGM